MKLTALLLLVVLFPTTVTAGSLICSGKVEQVAYHGNNKLMIKLSSMNKAVFFCDPGSDWRVTGEPNRVMSPDTCKAVFSIFLSARSTGETINRVHFDGDDVPKNCSSFESWKNVFIRYVNY
ncbi:hypothetical protein [Vibrio sp. AND4]|uniref:hypothetical protein n=1 Tax=Vibrio sp. AND4 TaxID=314289 RepID=UPI00015F3568|nr:hypothetical protein [Vibrio sp. AND4]EDP59773.1 hypothetical protein AND4_11464 [Vibrio sp. AND4]